MLVVVTRLVAAVSACAVLAACGPRPRPRGARAEPASAPAGGVIEDDAELWQTRPEQQRMEIAGPGRWSATGVAELHVRCFDVRTEVWCRPDGGCDERILEEVTTCEVTPLTVRSPWGATAMAVLDGSGIVSAVLDDTPQFAPPPTAALGWKVDGPDGVVAWGAAELPRDRADESVPLVEASVPAPPTHRRRNYAGFMIATDVPLLVIGFGFALSEPDWEDAEVRRLMYGVLLAHAVVGGIHHGIHGNGRRVVGSVARRLLVAAPGFALVGMMADSDEEDIAGALAAIFLLPLTVIGVVTMDVVDWTQAHVDIARRVHVRPTATAHRDGFTFGLGGSF